MARAVVGPRRGRRTLLPPALTVALWRLRTMWRLLLAAELGIVAAVLLLCVVPLFSRVAVNAGMRQALASNNGSVGPIGPGFRGGYGFGSGFGPAYDGGGANNSSINVIVNASQPTASLRDAAQQTFTPILQHYLGHYLTGASTFTIQTQPLPLMTSATSGQSAQSDMLMFYGVDLPSAAASYPVASGRLPSAQSSEIEIAITQAAATALDVAPGGIVRLAVPGGMAQPVPLRVVGILAANVSAGPFAYNNGAGQNGGPNGSFAQITALASNATLLNALGTLSTGQGQTSGGAYGGPSNEMMWTYPLDLSRLSVDDVDALTSIANPLQNDLRGALSGVTGVGDSFADLGPIYVLQQFSSRVAILQIPVILLLLQVLGLVLVFVRLMADILVERQAEAIAILRSRGAARRQIFGALTLHGLGLGALALVVGPLLAIPLVRVVASHVLAPSDRGAVDILAGNPLAVAWNVRWFALAAVVVSAVALIFSVNRAARANILALRRESAREGAKPLWQRLHLDLIVAVVGLALYGAYVLLLNQITDPNIRLALSPLALITPLFLLVGVALLFLRFFPLVLRLAAWGAARVRGAAAMVALAQMARSPRQALRMTLLFALSTGFSIFVLGYIASANQHALDVATFLVGADFNGQVASSATSTTPSTAAALAARYASLPGVEGASAGHTEGFFDQSNEANVQLFAVDPATYPQAMLWTGDDSTRPLADLMTTLTARGASAAASDTVPAIVDSAAARIYNLRPGGRFTLPVAGYGQSGGMRFQVAAIVPMMPQVPGDANSRIGGVLVDYASYASVYAADTGRTAPSADMVWLRTTDNATQLAGIRKALASGPLALSSLLDRRQLIDDQRNDPLQLNFVGVLGLGAATAVLLALFGTWLASWLSARARLTNFAVLRALGTTPRQTLRILVWEQGIVYVAALVLGIVLGALLEQAVLPTLVFANLVSTSSFNGRLGATNVPPVRAVVPVGTLALLLGVLVLACVLALALMAVTIARASLGQSLRLNED